MLTTAEKIENVVHLQIIKPIQVNHILTDYH